MSELELRSFNIHLHGSQKPEVTVILHGREKTIMETWNFRARAHLPLPNVMWQRAMTVIDSLHIYET